MTLLIAGFLFPGWRLSSLSLTICFGLGGPRGLPTALDQEGLIGWILLWTAHVRPIAPAGT
jgi:hypothetical protein